MDRITGMPNLFKTKVALYSLSLVLLIFSMSLVNAQAQAAETKDLIVLENLQSVAAQSSKSCVPMVIMVSQFSCTHCERLREKVLLPLLKSGEFNDKALFTELRIDSDELVTDLNGNTSTGMQLAKRYIKNVVTPTILIIDPSGNEVAERIVGISNIDFYSLYLEAEINAAYIKMKSMCLHNSENN